MSKLYAVKDFRTLPNGAYRYMRGLRRGYWRVLLVRDARGPTHYNSSNVRSIEWTGRDGILGVTQRSRYYLGGGSAYADALVAEFNRGM